MSRACSRWPPHLQVTAIMHWEAKARTMSRAFAMHGHAQVHVHETEATCSCDTEAMPRTGRE